MHAHGGSLCSRVLRVLWVLRVRRALVVVAACWQVCTQGRGNYELKLRERPVYLLQQIWGRPLHVWLLIASGIALIGLLLPWYSSQWSSNVSWQQRGFIYEDGTRSTWTVPVASLSSYGGGNGLNGFTFLLAAGIGGLGFAFRQGRWPKWASYALLAIVGLVVFVGLINFSADPHLGPLLFAAAGGLAAPAALGLVKAASAKSGSAPADDGGSGIGGDAGDALDAATVGDSGDAGVGEDTGGGGSDVDVDG